MDMQDVIACRRDGGRHRREEIEYLAHAAASGTAPDYQLAAWLMAAYLNPLSQEETVWLTLAMADSGRRMDLDGLPKPWMDKHSTGGVGDKTSLVLLPLLAACGLTMVKMSGRGLGITGGTIDKLSSVPGFRVDLTPDDLKAQAKLVGVALTGATPELAPADKTLYALRDATATVRSMPLIVSSILSKKLAGGAEALVLDVKCGSGAFMRSLDEATTLARMLKTTAESAGLKTRIAITDMDQPLGSCVGNALEVEEAVAVLDPTATLHPSSARFRRLCVELAGIALDTAGIPDGGERAERCLHSGAALDKAAQWWKAQGATADPRAMGRLTSLKGIELVHQGDPGWIHAIDAGVVGDVVLDLGGGRRSKEDPIDLHVGVSFRQPVGARIEHREPICAVYARSAEEAAMAVERLQNAVDIRPEPTDARDLILSVL